MQQFATPFWEPSLPRGAGVLLLRMRGLRACWAGLGAALDAMALGVQF